MPTVLSFYNGKGGSGKTTSTLSLGTQWASEDRPVLLVDLDPQGSLSRWLGEKGTGSRALLSGDVVEDVVSKACGLQYVASDRSLGDLEMMRAGKLVRGLENLFSVTDAELVLIDPPPAAGTLSTVSLLASDYVVAPVEASMGAVDGLRDTLGLIRQVGTQLLGVFGCRVDERTRNDQDATHYLADALGEKAFSTYIRETVKVREAMARRVPLIEYAPDSTAAQDYAALSNEIIQRLHA